MLPFILIASFLLRLVGLNQSLWLDEAVTAKVVSQYNYGQILTQFSPHDFHPPLYYLFMKFWTGMFGYSEVALRMPSVLASLLTGYVVYKIIGMLRKPKSISVWAAAFFLFNPLIVYYSQEARMYSMATLFITLISWSVTKLPFEFAQGKQVKSSKLKVGFIMLANIFEFLALVTFYGSAFFVFSLHAYLLFKRSYKTMFLLFPGSLFAAALLSPLFFDQLKNSGEVLKQIPNWSLTLGKANLKNLLLIPIKFTSGRISFEPKILYYSIAGVWAAFVWLLCLKNILNTKYRILYTAFLLPILLGFGISFYKPLLQYFRFIYVIPFMCMLLAIGANKKWQRVALLTGFIVFSLIYTYIPSFHREDWKGLVASLPASKICALPSSFDPLSYYNPKLITSDARTCTTGNGEIVVVPYVEDIYGFDHKEYLSQRKYSLIKEVSFRGVSYEQWSKDVQ